MDLGYAGKRCLVTASTGGLGFAIAKCMAAEGADVVVNGRSARNLAETKGTTVTVSSVLPGPSRTEGVAKLIANGAALRIDGGLIRTVA